MPFRGIIATILLGLGLSLAPAVSPALAGDAARGAKPAAKTARLSPAVEEAIDFRRLQSELMVAALSCRDARYREHYNLFVTRFRPALSENARVLKSYFRRLHGPRAIARLDAFMTKLANEASLASMRDANFCVNALARLEAINHTDQDQTAGRIVEEPGISAGQ